MPTKKRKHTTKVELVFDAKERSEFLTGFQKRKFERKQTARVEAEKKYKEEINKIKKKKRDELQKRYEEMNKIKAAEFGALSSLNKNDDLDNVKPTMIDMESHTVTLTTAEEIDLSQKKDSYFLGSNTTNEVEVFELKNNEKENNDDADKEDSGDDEINENQKCTGNPISKREKRRNMDKLAQLSRKKGVLSKKRTKLQPIKSKSAKKFLRKRQKMKGRQEQKTKKTST